MKPTTRYIPRRNDRKQKRKRSFYHKIHAKYKVPKNNTGLTQMEKLTVLLAFTFLY